MSADLISPTGVDIGSSQVDDPCIQGFLALLETDIQKGRHQSSLSDGLMQAMLEDGLLAFEQPTFETVMASCASIQDEINRLARRD